jgi:hypothetical protein
LAPSVAILVYGDDHSGRNALTEEKYRDLAEALFSAGFTVTSVLYTDEAYHHLRNELPGYDAVLVWINPIEQGKDRALLDTLLREIAGKSCFVSAHPDTILKMGTKEVLYATKDMGWGGDVRMYTSFKDFRERFLPSLQSSGARILKQYRGNGGNGVFKIVLKDDLSVTLTHAVAGDHEEVISMAALYNTFQPFFLNGSSLIDQEWNNHTVNGMVRCYVAGTKVAGFGYQEVNALYELNNDTAGTYFPPSKRYYFSENCGLFNDLKETMETLWIPQLQQRLSLPGESMPVIWDADFFINSIDKGVNKYTLCEINVSCVSPFPPGAVKFIVQVVRSRVNKYLPTE